MNFQKILELFLKFLKICILKNFLPEVEVKRMNISNSLKIIHHIKGGDLRLSILHSHSHDCTLIPGMLWKIVPSREISAVRIELLGLESMRPKSRSGVRRYLLEKVTSQNIELWLRPPWWCNECVNRLIVRRNYSDVTLRPCISVYFYGPSQF